MFFSYYDPRYYPHVIYYPVPYVRQTVQPLQISKPHLTTWPYSNVYYGNYYEA
ncbi:hypothetical protein M3215_08705 [Bacillus cytotoxicus]|uniref:Uncharacterized protein n=1 Tax=Bacillus cytotoxicus TaxID=580165 RepID=A0ACC6A4S5_9BACI|nr:hypothetical protein [Bacillus cytotoxicus]HDX9580450.1 hypothetical protein [Bacillus pseudomycoides]